MSIASCGYYWYVTNYDSAASSSIPGQVDYSFNINAPLCYDESSRAQELKPFSATCSSTTGLDFVHCPGDDGGNYIQAKFTLDGPFNLTVKAERVGEYTYENWTATQTEHFNVGQMYNFTLLPEFEAAS